MILTSKIELRVVGSQEERDAAWKYLRELNQDVFKAYNLVISNQYFNQMFTERIRKTDDELMKKNNEVEDGIEELTQAIKKCKDKDEKAKLTDKRKKLYKAQNMLNNEARVKAEQMYLTSEENSTYQLLGKAMPDMPSTIRTSINSDAVAAFRNDIFEVRMGKKTIRTYREGVPIPFQKTAIRFFKNDKGEIGMNWINNISFMLMFGQDKSNNREIVERAMGGTYKYSDSKIQIKDRKIFLLFCVNIPEERKELNYDLCVGVNLGIVVPAYCALSSGLNTMAIGSIDDLFRVRIQMQKRRQRLQKHLKMAKGGRGRQDKLKALETLSEKERNFVRTYNHMISYQIIKFALRNGAGTIKMELLEGYGEDEKNKIILRNWSYYELHQMVEYKPKKFGMKVLYTDPYMISQTCNCCKQYNEFNLETRNDFVCKNKECKNYNVTVFSDYNAALNNAHSLRIVTKKEDCEFYKKYEEQTN